MVDAYYNESGINVKVSVSDPDGDKITLTFEPGSKAMSYNSETGMAILDSFKDVPGKYVAKFKATDPDGASSEASLSYEIKDNRAPYVEATPAGVTLKAHESAVISVNATDPDGDSVTYALESAGSDAVVFDVSTRTVRITAAKVPVGGSFKAVVKVTDTPTTNTVQPKSATVDIPYIILPNTAPTVTSAISDISQYGLNNISVNIGSHFKDLDGEVLRYEVSVKNESIAAAQVSSETAVITPKTYGVTTVTITARDGIGTSATLSFNVAFVNAQQPVTVGSSQVTEDLTLNIDAASPVSVEVLVYNTSGAQVLRKIVTASVFNPVQLDVSSLSPGRYTAIVKYGGMSTTVKFVKY